MVRVLLFSTSLLIISFTAFPALADNDGRLQPKVETSLKYGTERTIGNGSSSHRFCQGSAKTD